jgi:hypothetical protein
MVLDDPVYQVQGINMCFGLSKNTQFFSQKAKKLKKGRSSLVGRARGF